MLNDRIDQQMDQISTMRSTIGKLESDLDFQKQNHKVLGQQVEAYEKELKRANDSLSGNKVKLDSLQARLDTANNQLLDQQQELAKFRYVLVFN